MNIFYTLVFGGPGMPIPLMVFKIVLRLRLCLLCFIYLYYNIFDIFGLVYGINFVYGLFTLDS